MSIFKHILNTATAMRLLMKHEKAFHEHAKMFSDVLDEMKKLQEEVENNAGKPFNFYTNELATMKQSLLDLGKSFQMLKQQYASGFDEARYKALEKKIADSESEMIREARSWKEIAYAVAKQEDIKKEIFRRDRESLQ